MTVKLGFVKVVDKKGKTILIGWKAEEILMKWLIAKSRATSQSRTTYGGTYNMRQVVVGGKKVIFGLQ